MNTLFGQAPKATFSTQPTISPPQQAELPTLIDTITQFLQGAGAAAPAAGVTAMQTLAPAAGAIPGQVGYQAPMIDATQAFRTGVVEPTTQDFLQRTLPGIAGRFGGSAGGTFGSGSATAREQAGLDTTRALAEAGSRYSLGAATANQQAANTAAQIRNAALNAATGVAGTQAGIPGQATQAISPFLQLLSNLTTAPTQQTSAVGTGGSQGIAPALLNTAAILGSAYLTGGASLPAMAALMAAGGGGGSSGTGGLYY